MEMLLSLLSAEMLVKLASIVGGFRLFFKPIMYLIETYVKKTGSKEDDAALQKIKESGIYKVLVWFIDYLTSVKLPK